MIIVGFTGPINHGKSTAAEYLRENEPNSKHLESWQIVAEVAQPLISAISENTKSNDLESVNKWLESLPEIIGSVLNSEVSYEQLKIEIRDIESDPDLFQKLFDFIDSYNADPDSFRGITINEENKESFRSILQWLGGYLFAKKPGLWYREIARRIDESKGLDLYTVSGLRFPSDADQLISLGATIVQVVRPTTDTKDLKDPTERERSAIHTDTTIVNNGNLEDLKETIGKFWLDLKADDLKPEYVAKS